MQIDEETSIIGIREKTFSRFLFSCNIKQTHASNRKSVRRQSREGQMKAKKFLVGAALLMSFTTLFSFSPVQGAEAAGGNAPANYALVEGMNEFGFWAGGSPTSNVAIGRTPDTSLLLVGLRYGRVLKAWESISLQYTLDILPAAVVSIQ
jgi:hypothetical protein